MAKLWAVIRREYLDRVRTKWFIIATVVGPLLFLAMSILPVYLVRTTSASTEATKITIIDATGTGLGDKLATILATDSTGKVLPRPPVVVVGAPERAAAESAAATAVTRKERIGYLVLDATTLRGDSAQYVGRNTTTVADMNKIGRAVDRAVVVSRLEREGISAERVDSLTDVDVRLAKQSISDTGGRQKSGAGSNIFGIMVAFLLYMVIVLYGQNVLRSVIEEKSTRVAEVVISSVRPEILLAGKIIGIGGVALSQMVLWIVSYFWLGAKLVPMMMARRGGAGMADTLARVGRRGPDIAGTLPDISVGLMAALLLFLLLGYVFYSTLYAAVGATVNSESEAQQASTPVIMLLVASAVFIQPIALAPQSTLSVVMSMLPFCAPILMPMRMSVVAVPPWQIIVSIVGTMVACAIAIWIAARIYRVGLLMYGKRPTFGELIKWLRYS
jgi:ABC-2 type transport system permease protein